jgi:hypothetical protein
MLALQRRLTVGIGTGEIGKPVMTRFGPQEISVAKKC